MGRRVKTYKHQILVIIMGDIINFYDSFLEGMPAGSGLMISLLFFTIVIVIYGVFVYYFYRFLAKKNLIAFNFNQYNTSEHPFAMKLFGFIFYVLEYIILLPVLTFFWFAVLAIFIMLLASQLEIAAVLTIAAALVASVRVTAYISENLSKDLAKMLPFTLLALALTNPNFFDISRFLGRLGEIPSVVGNLSYYLVFIIILELIMRMGDLIHRTLKNTEEPAVE